MGSLSTLVYVDDILVTGTDAVLVQGVTDALAAKFSIKDMGNLGYFLGIETIKDFAGSPLDAKEI